MKKLNLIIFLFTIISVAKAQNVPMLDKIKSQNEKLPIEKLYLTLDKPYYNAGDTIWFKSFLLNGDLTAAQRSDKIHVELYNDSLRIVDSKVIALNNGLGYGDFDLPNKMYEGTYTIRSYSNWQQNFGSDYFFQKSFYIGNAGEKTWLLDSYQKLNSVGAKKTLELKVRITNIKNEAAGLKDVEIILMNDKKRLMKADLQTTLAGLIDTKIPLGENKLSGNYSLLIIDRKDKSRQATLPIILQEVDQVDIQFMPESGHMINGIYGKVAFKVIGADGLGKKLSGKIVNNKNEVVADFSTIHQGMGSFYLMPKLGDTYTAVYNLNDTEQKALLPLAKEEGTALRIDHLSNKDSIYVYIKASPLNRLPNYQFTAQHANDVVLAASINLSPGLAILKLPKQDFPDGIIHFTLFSSLNIALNERLVLINKKQKINLQIKENKSSYFLKDSVSLEITATNESGEPLSGSFAISVTDDGQIKQQSTENIVSHFLLQSDLKGNIEDAAWYFKNEDEKTKNALDHLLLTQGWIGYNWEKTLVPINEPMFKPEKGSEVSGRVTGLFKGREGIDVNMLSFGKQMVMADTRTDANGNFVFKDLPLADSTAYNIKIKNDRGKTATGNIFVDEFKRSQTPLNINLITPWYVNSDSTTLNYFKTVQQQVKKKEKDEMIRTGTLLNEVVIQGQMRRKEIVSKDAWDAGFFKTINEEELKKVPQKTLRNLLEERIPEFNVGNLWTDACSGRPSIHSFRSFRIGSSLISHVLIDKLNTNIVASGTQDTYQQTGISITGLEETGKLVFETNTYIFNALSASEVTNITFYKGCHYYFLDITTRSGKGPWITPTPGRYIYRPLPIYMAKDFYSPKYTAKENSIPDYRSTIFWDANVVTDENGKAKVSFYSADKPSTYTVKVEGTDLYGRFGFQKSSIKIVNKTASK